MKRTGTFKPTIEDIIELSGIETLHPGGLRLTQRTAEVAGMRPGLNVLDVSSGRGTQALYYAREYGVHVTGLDLSPEMVRSASEKARAEGMGDRTRFELGDAQALPFRDQTFDIVVNECAVGIPDDSEKVVAEMVRVSRPGGTVVIHESTWRARLSPEEKHDIAERYGTTPLEYEEWVALLAKGGLRNIETEFDRWSSPEMFWKIRKDRNVTGPRRILSLREKARTLKSVFREYGLKGVRQALENERQFLRVVTGGKLGYCLFWGTRPVTA